MRRLFTDRKRLLHLVGAVVLLGGLGTALLLYQTREDVPDNDLVYQMHHTKRYRHDLQVIGGQMSLLADDLALWFDRLWQGRSLAYTIAWMTVIVSSGFFLVAHHLSAGPRPEV